MITINNISKAYIDNVLFTNVSFNVSARDRIAVIGANGSGKTTLFEIITGNIAPDKGSVTMRKGTTIGYLKQDIITSSKKRLLEDVTSSSTEITGMAHRISVLQQDLAEETDEETSTELMEKLGELQTGLKPPAAMTPNMKPGRYSQDWDSRSPTSTAPLPNSAGAG